MASIFDLEVYKPYREQLSARAASAKTFVDWYTSAAYEAKNVQMAGEFQAKVKALFHPLTRATDLHAAFLPGFPEYAFTREQKDNEMNVLLPGTDPAHIQLVHKLLRWSRWNEYGPLNNMNFALKGRGIVSLVDRSAIDPTRPVVFDVRDPANTLLVFNDRWSQFPSLMISVTQEQPPGTTKVAEFATIITPEETLLFYDGAPYNAPPNPDGTPGMLANTPNAFGFVPVVEARFRDIGNGVDQNVFSSVLPVIMTVNKMATYIMGVIGTYFEPQLFVAGAERADEDIEWGRNVMYGPGDSKAQLLLADLDIAGATRFVETVHAEVKANLPELIFGDIRGINRISTEGLELQFAELISKLTVSRSALDRSLNDIFKVGLWAAGESGAEGFENIPSPLEPEFEEFVLELDPYRGYVPLGESALLAIEKQRIDVESARVKLEHLKEEGDLRIEAMRNTEERAGSSGPGDGTGLTESNASNPTDKPNPTNNGPDATSPGAKTVLTER